MTATTTRVPFLDVRAAHEEMREELRAAYERVMASGVYILGDEVTAFEKAFARACGARFCVGVSNGLDALHLLLRACGVGEGADDEVLVPSHTFIATWLAVTHAGARIVPVECDPATYNLDPAALERAITPRTRAIIAVHLYGQPADMDAINAIAARCGLVVLEDAAQAHGACLGARRAGALGHAAAFSFYPAKNLGALGDGGAVVTNDALMAEELRRLRNYGSRAKYEHDAVGYNARLDPLQAAFLRAKLPHLERWNARRRAVAARYVEGLAGARDLVLPHVRNDVLPSWHLFVIRHRRRDALQAFLQERGIDTLIHYPIPPHRSGAYAEEHHGPLPIAEELARTVLSLPMGPHLSDDAVDYVIAAVREFADA
ncbi:MAG TPA: DegT/DnrJ/EryC1/StrS family aminotransferase [Thermoanaerobaculia bacterium]